MSETTTAENGYIGYEYKEVTVRREMEPIYVDGYTSFGWQKESCCVPATGQSTDLVSLKFKRNRKIRNKAELTRLQRQFEECANEIVSLERAKTTSASILAYTVGLLGTVFMACSVFAYIGGLVVPSILLAVPAILGWIIPYFAYCVVKKNKTARLTPIIDQKYDEIYANGEKANGLVNG